MLGKPQKIDRTTRKIREQYSIDTPRPGLLQWLTLPVTYLSRWLDVLLLEKRKWNELSWRHRIRGWRYGFSSLSYNLYQLEHNPPQEYIPDIASLRFGYEINGHYNETVFSKVTFSRILKSLQAPQPPILGTLFRGTFYAENGQVHTALDGVRFLLTKGKKLVLRPSFGSGGAGILFLEQSSAGYMVNSLPADAKTFEFLLEPLHDYLVTEFVVQAGYAAEIAPGSTNTLRILTLWDVESNQPFVAASCHRFGRESSGPLDNFHAGAGGLSVPIDLDSGELGRAVIREDGEIKRVGRHPDTGKVIEGVFVPDWKQTINELLLLAARLPYAPCIGWDLVKLEEGWVCLEGNPFPGYHVWQVHGPILKDARARRFYHEFGMLK